MSRPSFEDIFNVMSAASVGDSNARVKLPADATHANGWDYAPDGKSVVLYGPPCQSLMDGSGKNVQIIYGCPDPKAGAVRTLGQFPLGFRIANAIVSYARYIAKTFWPTRLTVFYPPPDRWPVATVIVSAALLFAITIIAIRRARSRPYLLVGWLWFLGTLVPVIGILQVHDQAMADPEPLAAKATQGRSRAPPIE